MSPLERHRYEELLQQYLSPLRRLAWSYARDATEVDDLLQEIALALWTALPRFRGDSSERTWLYRIAHNTGISFLASGRRRATRETAVFFPDEFISGSNPETDAIQRERLERLWTAVRELPVLDRQIACLYLEGLSAAAIQEVVGLSAGTIATRLTRLRQRLMRRMRGEEVRA